METLPASIALESYSTQELLDELCKREGVVDVKITPHDNGEYFLPCAARILVVKE